MARPVTLFTGQWADLTLEVICQKASQWGYDGIELPCWGDHFNVQKALERRRATARGGTTCSAKYGLKCWAISNHLTGQLVLDHHRRPDRRLGARRASGATPRRRREWAIQEMKDTARAAQKLGVKVVNGFTGSSIWHLLYSFPPVSDAMIDDGFKLLAERWNPILDVFKECGVKFAPGGPPDRDRLRHLLGRDGAEGGRPPPRVRLQLRPEPPALADGRPGRVHPGLPRPDLPRPRQGRRPDARRQVGHPRLAPQLRRPAPRLGLPLAGPGPGRLRGDRPGAQPRSATRARSRSSGKTAAWIANTARPRRPGSSRRRWASRRPAGSSTRPSPRARPDRGRRGASDHARRTEPARSDRADRSGGTPSPAHRSDGRCCARTAARAISGLRVTRSDVLNEWSCARDAGDLGLPSLEMHAAWAIEPRGGQRA